jgi:hypothetical protein
MEVCGHALGIYVDFGADSAVLGLLASDDPDRPRYFPMYASTYRGLPEFELDVLVSEDCTGMWVTSTWPGYECLAFHVPGSNECVTRYGQIASFDAPTPARLSGTPIPFPKMTPRELNRITSLHHGPDGGT